MLTSVTKGIRSILLRRMDIREGELRRVWFMQLNLFLLILCLWIIKPVVNAQFLSVVGIDKLPSAFLMVALTALIVSISYSKLLSRLPLGTIMKRTYLISIICLLSFAVLMHFHLFRAWISYLFYIGVALFGLITTSQFWLMGNMVFSSLEAKRLFGFIGAGAITGGIIGGYVTSSLAPLLNSSNLLFLAVILLSISMWVNHKIHLHFVPAQHSSLPVHQPKQFHQYPLRLIGASKHLTFLALIMGISVIVDKLVEFQFSSIASSEISDQDELTAFFGFWFSTSNVVSLLFQLFITQKLVALLGVGRSLLVFPGTLFSGTLLVLFSPVLWAGTTLKLMDISLKQSINKAATELLVLPVPMAIKAQAKTFIDVFVDTTATGIGGIILIFIINGLNLSVRAVCMMIIVLISLWIYLAIRARKEYIKSFQDKLGLQGQKHRRKEYMAWDEDVVSGIRNVLKDGSTKQILFMLSKIEESKDVRLMPDTIPLLKHHAAEVRESALRCLYYHKDPRLVSEVEPMLKDPDSDVRSRAFSCLLAHTDEDRIRFADNYLSDKDPAIRAAALIGLATEARDNPQLQKTYNLMQRVQDTLNSTGQLRDPEEKKANTIAVIRAIGYGRIDAFYPVLLSYTGDPDPEIATQALLAIGNTQVPQHVEILLDHLEHKSTRKSARKALAKYEPSELLPLLEKFMASGHLKNEVMIQLPSLAKFMDTEQAIEFLFTIYQRGQSELKNEALETLHVMKMKFPHLNIRTKRIQRILNNETLTYKKILSLQFATQNILDTYRDQPEISRAVNTLLGSLDMTLQNILKQIFLSLRILYPDEAILPLVKDLRSQDPTTRANALELLDNILSPIQKHTIMPVAESLLDSKLSNEIPVRLTLTIPSMYVCFETILKSGNDQLKMDVLGVIEVLDITEFMPLLKQATKDEHEKIRMTAQRLLIEKGSEKQENPVAPG